MNKKIYLDYNASTPIAPEAIEAMQPFLTDHYGNPSSSHWAGIPAKNAVAKARGQIADLIGCTPEEIVFTSGGTEANNHALKGVFFAAQGKGDHIVTTAVEHPSILNPCRFLEKLGAQVTVLPVDRFGMVDPDDVKRAVTPKTVLITVMHANNEVGTIQPISKIAAIARETGVLFHTDAAQSIGKIPADVNELGVDLLSVAGHKLYAPKGIGALYIRKGTSMEPFMHGAGHEAGRRAGTENVLLAVALGAACSSAQEWDGLPQLQALRDRFWEMLQKTFGDKVSLNGHPTERLPNTLNINFIGRIGSEILAQLPEIAASTGSACHSGSVTLSPVLAAMGVPPEEGMGAIRFSLGRYTTADEIEEVLALLRTILSKA
ncbi:MAG: cysteine desulfurase [Nitrospirae bacterium]|nr:cysteine desulfurase [Nitrospirota bacterium]